MIKTKSIFLIGSGNLAWHILACFNKKNISIAGIYSRNNVEAKYLAEKFNCKFYNSLSDLKNKAGIFLLCVNDANIEKVASVFTKNDQYLIHFSGSVSLKTIEKYNKNSGVFYILQSFTKNIPVNFKGLPVFIETNNKYLYKFLIHLAKLLQLNVYCCNSAKRKKIHIAGIISSNFVNFLILLIQEYLTKNKINKSIINRIVLHTVNKALRYGAKVTQTGPALRKEKKIIKQHLKILRKHKTLFFIYKFFTKEIQKRFT
ncbi:MAG: DUF2520 domain-containing protein [Bacteroidales bacterium]|nr:DUF2520 domain-containing protein [Bacteroidales bacterium]